MEIVDFPVKISLCAYQQPVKETVFETVQGYTGNESILILKWVSGKRKKIHITKKEELTKETKSLLDTLAAGFIRKNGAHKEILDLIMSYWGKWGPILPGRKEIYLTDLLLLGWFYAVVDILWHESEKEKLPNEIENFFRTVRIHTLNTTNSPIPRYWYIRPAYNGDLFEYVPCYDKAKNLPFYAYIRQPSVNDLENFNIYPESKGEWIRDSIMQNVADYITAQKLKYEASVYEYEVQFIGKTDNLFLAFLMNDVLRDHKAKIIKCKCGCGRLVPPERKDFATPQCKEKAPFRKIDKWLYRKMERGQITQQFYDSLRKIAKKKIEEECSEEEVRIFIKSRITV